MRNVFIGFLFLVAIWIGWGAPVPGVRVTEMKPDPSLPTFQPLTTGETFHRTDRGLAADAEFAGRLTQDQTMRPLRERVVNAANRLEAFPCDAAAKRELRTAVSAFMKEQLRRIRAGKDSETVTVNGRTVDASAHLNREVAAITDDAVFQGVLQPEDLGIPRGLRPPAGLMGGAFDTKGRFVCENDFSKR
jgi:hypothetical protein